MDEYICKCLKNVQPNWIKAEYIKDGRKCMGEITRYNGESAIISPYKRTSNDFDVIKLTDLISCSQIPTPRELIGKFYKSPLVKECLPKGLIIKDTCRYGRIESVKDEHGYEYVVVVGKWDFDTGRFTLTGERRVLHLPFETAFDTVFEERIARERQALANNVLPVLTAKEMQGGKKRYHKNDLIRFSNENIVAKEFFEANGISDCHDESYSWFDGVIADTTDKGLIVRELECREQTGRWYPAPVGKTRCFELRQTFVPGTKTVSYKNLPERGIGRLGFLDRRGLWLIAHHPREWNGYTDRY